MYVYQSISGQIHGVFVVGCSGPSCNTLHESAFHVVFRVSSNIWHSPCALFVSLSSPMDLPFNAAQQKHEEHLQLPHKHLVLARSSQKGWLLQSSYDWQFHPKINTSNASHAILSRVCQHHTSLLSGQASSPPPPRGKLLKRVEPRVQRASSRVPLRPDNSWMGLPQETSPKPILCPSRANAKAREQANNRIQESERTLRRSLQYGIEGWLCQQTISKLQGACHAA